jgi:hypothetical protein
MRDTYYYRYDENNLPCHNMQQAVTFTTEILEPFNFVFGRAEPTVPHISFSKPLLWAPHFNSSSGWMHYFFFHRQSHWLLHSDHKPEV